MSPDARRPPLPVARAYAHRASLHALAARLSEEYAGVATPGRVLAAVWRVDRSQRGRGAARLAAVELEVRRMLGTAAGRRLRAGVTSEAPGPGRTGPAAP